MIEELDQEHINLVLNTQQIGHLACAVDDQPYVVPVTYVYENGCIYGHTNEGMKAHILRRNPKVCFEVELIEDMTKWRSVVAFGTFEELHGPEAAKALDLLITRLAPLAVSESLASPEGPLDTVSRHIKLKPTKGITYRIRLQEVTGRYERH